MRRVLSKADVADVVRRWHRLPEEARSAIKAGLVLPGSKHGRPRPPMPADLIDAEAAAGTDLGMLADAWREQAIWAFRQGRPSTFDGRGDLLWRALAREALGWNFSQAAICIVAEARRDGRLPRLSEGGVGNALDRKVGDSAVKILEADRRKHASSIISSRGFLIEIMAEGHSFHEAVVIQRRFKFRHGGKP